MKPFAAAQFFGLLAVGLDAGGDPGRFRIFNDLPSERLFADKHGDRRNLGVVPCAVIVFLTRLVFSHRVILQPTEILFHPGNERGVILVGPRVGLLQQRDRIENANEVPRVDDARAAPSFLPGTAWP